MSSQPKHKPPSAAASSRQSGEVASQLPRKEPAAPLPVFDAPTSQRAANMRAVRSKDTTPELVVRELARALSPGYRLNRRDIPGKPDLAWIGARKAVFVHGCFWHGHDCARGARVPKTNRDYWLAKVSRNVERDRRTLETLGVLGWDALTIWECELRDREMVIKRLRAFLT